ncbi:MAG: hypothetical protein OQK99_01135 [Gammaproteobacteria bacterium]|jgi:hypothetical protein|nr:hypothetical protein [Gammaproteobacteria bacterium]
MLAPSYKLLLPLLLCCIASVHADDTDPPSAKATGQRDVLQLDSSAVTGNQELPKVLYIVPWKHAGVGDLAGRPVNSLLDEVLAPIDREVFQRQVRYFNQLHANDTRSAAKE